MPSSPVYEVSPVDPPPTLGEAPKKKTKAQLMMEKMGYVAGKGLGKTSEGRLDAVITTEKLDKTVPFSHNHIPERDGIFQLLC